MSPTTSPLERERELAGEIRQLLLALHADLSRGDGEAADTSRVWQAAQDLRDLFLVVVVGEWNAGKSALINALIGRRLLEEGVTPTTTAVQVITFGAGEASAGAQPNRSGAALKTASGVITRQLEVPELKDIKVVDTPGTNAIIREHEVITRDFMPRADLVLFVTSADRPFTESERAFLTAITEWGKKVVFVINKADLLSEREETEVRAFVGRALSDSLGFAVPVFAVSAREAERRIELGDRELTLMGPPPANSAPSTGGSGRQSGDKPALSVSPGPASESDSAGDRRSGSPSASASAAPDSALISADANRSLEGWRQFVTWLRGLLLSPERWHLKLANPLSLAGRVIGDSSARVRAQLTVLEADAQAVAAAQDALDRFESETRTQFSHRLDAVDNHLLRLTQRASTFLDTYYRLGRVRSLLNGDALRQAFEAEVIGQTPQAIATEVEALVDWLVDREHAERLEVRRHLLEAGGGVKPPLDGTEGASFAKRRQDLVASVAKRAEEITASFNPAAESARLVAGIHDTLAHAGLAEAGALGLGLLLKAIIAPAIFEATGVVAAGLLIALGLSVIPRRRAQAARSLADRIDRLGDELREQLGQSLDQEILQNRHSWDAALQPYAHFVSEERGHLEALHQRLTALDEQRRRLVELVSD